MDELMDTSNENNFGLTSLQDALAIISELPCKLIVTKVPDQVYKDSNAKDAFETLFRSFDGESHFVYLRSFRRVQVRMSSPNAALLARIRTQGWTLPPDLLGEGELESSEGIRCFFGQPDPCDSEANSRQNTIDECNDRLSWSSSDDNYDQLGELSPDQHFLHSNVHLAPPKTKHLFLLSPPASPPVGWEPKPEAQPIINYELLAALADLEPGKDHELHPPCESSGQPSIIVTPCETVKERRPVMHGGKVIPTRRPERQA